MEKIKHFESSETEVNTYAYDQRNVEKYACILLYQVMRIRLHARKREGAFE